MTAYVLLEDGTRFDGEAVGAPASVTGEVVFTTGMSGYQESMSDPSFARQLITFTAPHVGKVTREIFARRVNEDVYYGFSESRSNQ